MESITRGPKEGDKERIITHRHRLPFIFSTSIQVVSYLKLGEPKRKRRRKTKTKTKVNGQEGEAGESRIGKEDIAV